jgi:hypothetical protein
MTMTVHTDGRPFVIAENDVRTPIGRRTRPLATARTAVLSAALLAVSVWPSNAASAQPVGDSAPADSSEFFRTYRNYRTYAVEDTLPPQYRSRQETLVTAPRVTLDEIIARAIDAEKNKYGNIDEISFTATTRVVEHYGSPGDDDYRRKVNESVDHVVHTQETMQAVSLGERTFALDGAGNPEPSEVETNVEVAVESAREGLTYLPHFFEDRSRYRFEIVQRELLDDRVLYDIRFDPRSDFDALPSGHFWIDTTDFQIFHTEMQFLKNVPFPLLLKGVDHVAIENRREYGYWVLHRVSARVQLRNVPLVKIPDLVELAISFDDFAINDATDASGAEGDLP